MVKKTPLITFVGVGDITDNHLRCIASQVASIELSDHSKGVVRVFQIEQVESPKGLSITSVLLKSCGNDFRNQSNAVPVFQSFTLTKRTPVRSASLNFSTSSS